MQPPRYHINLFWSDEDAAWIADVPDLRYCSAHGDTPEKALREIQTARAAWLKAQEAEGRLLPEPRHRPAIYAAHPTA